METIHDYNRLMGAKTLHPLLSVTDLSELKSIKHCRKNFGFNSDKPKTSGLLTVQYCAEKVCLSTNYFGDLIKKETGKSAQEYIQCATMARAKELLTDTDETISEIAYELGFNYPHHLSRVFRKVTGLTPNEYRIAN